MVLRPDEFTEQAQEVLAASQEIMRRYRHSQWDSEHVLMALLEQEKGVPVEILLELGVSVEAMRERLHQLLEQAPKVSNESPQVFATPRVQRLGERAKAEAERLNDEYISTEHLLVALVQEDQGDVAQVVRQLKVDLEQVYQALHKIRGGHRVTDPRAESRYRSLERYSLDLTQLARDGKLDPVIGREVEIARAMQTLIRRTKNNPVLIGGAGVGKTTRYIEKDAALERRFQPILVEEPDMETTVEMLRALRPRYEAHHKVLIDDSALEAATRLSQRYISDRLLPDKAVDLIDEAASKIRIESQLLPPELQEKESRLRQLENEEEAASQRANYQRAAELRSERLRLQEEFDGEKGELLRERDIDMVVPRT